MFFPKSFDTLDENGDPVGAGLYNMTKTYNASKDSDFHRAEREKDAAENRADDLEAARDGITRLDVRKKRQSQQRASARSTLLPRVLKRLGEIGTNCKDASLDEDLADDGIQFYYKIGKSKVKECNSDFNEFMIDHVMSYRQR